jgi:hypothetical protein
MAGMGLVSDRQRRGGKQKFWFWRERNDCRHQCATSILWPLHLPGVGMHRRTTDPTRGHHTATNVFEGSRRLSLAYRSCNRRLVSPFIILEIDTGFGRA